VERNPQAKENERNTPEEHCALENLCVYAFAFLAALPFARLAAQAFSSAFLQAALIFLLGF
jgi:hypothetical protein